MIVFDIIIIMIFHWIADFMCQTNWQATNKWNNTNALMAHCWGYTCLMAIGFALLFPNIPTIAITIALVNGILHFGIDYISSKVTHYLYEQKEYHWFFVVIGADQLIHTIILLLSIAHLTTY